MTEIRSLPPNGLTVVSTFSGGGGSSLGYAMAGYKVALASEFVPAARATYARNFPNTQIASEDIRELAGAAILERIGMREGELDVLDGSPPCASFSTAGKRERGWGESKKYSDVSQRSDDLFFEYARLVDQLRPRAFVAENVSGLVKGTAKGYFIQILAKLKASGYRVRARLLDAQWLGVPQQRQRIIFLGFRDDQGIDPEHPAPFSHRYSIREALEGVELSDDERDAVSIEKYAIGPEWHRLIPGQTSEKYFSLSRPDPEKPSPTITATAGNPGAASVVHHGECRKYAVRELLRLCSFPDDFLLEGTYLQQVERLGRAVPPLMMKAVAETVARQLFAASGKP